METYNMTIITTITWGAQKATFYLAYSETEDSFNILKHEYHKPPRADDEESILIDYFSQFRSAIVNSAYDYFNTNCPAVMMGDCGIEDEAYAIADEHGTFREKIFTYHVQCCDLYIDAELIIEAV